MCVGKNQTHVIFVAIFSICSIVSNILYSDVLVSTYTINDQKSPHTTVDNFGNYIITWSSYGNDGSGWGVFARKFNSNGIPISDEFQVNSTTYGDQIGSHIDCDGFGNFTILWVNTNVNSIYIQKFDNDCNKIGYEFLVSTTNHSSSNPKISINKNGDFIITWMDETNNSSWDVFAKLFNNNMDVIKSTFTVNENTSGDQYYPDVEINEDGEFFIVWDSSIIDGSGHGISIKHFDENGISISDTECVNTYTDNNQGAPEIAMDSTGNFIVVWWSIGNDGSGHGVAAQSFDSLGCKIGSESVVNTCVFEDQANPEVGMNDYGDYVISWHSRYQDGSSLGVFAQNYERNSIKFGEEYQVNDYTLDNQYRPSIAIANNGVYVISWHSYAQDGSGWGIYANFYGQSILPAFSLNSPDRTFNRGEDVELTIRVTNNSSVVGYRVALDLDPSKVTYVDGSATKEGTSTEIGWGPLVVNSASPEQAIFTCASATGTLSSASATLMKFQLHVNEMLPDFTPINITFNPLTSLNEDAIAYSAEIWSATVLGPNHIPSFNGGPSEIVLEDCGPQEKEGWATNIYPGAPYEEWQSINFTVDVNYPWLLSTTPTIDAASGTLRYTPAPNAYGTISCTAVLHDSGGIANGGIDQSTPYFFSITIDPVNDRPSFIVGATPVVLNATGGQHTFKNWATDISAGPPNEVTQTVNFNVSVDRPELFSATPYITPSGNLLYTPAVGAHGVVRATAFMYDSGGIANGGVNMATPQAFAIKIFIPYLWGDLNDNDQAGSVDASLLLQYAAELIDVFPGYPVSDYPEYYPDQTQTWNYFPPAADVNADGIAGTWDASLVLQKYVYLINWFPADSNHDQWGPDAPLPPGKVSVRNASRNLSVAVEEISDSYYITFKIDDADDLSGLRIVLLFDPTQASVDESLTKWLVPNGMLVTNNIEAGRFIAAGALTVPLNEGPSDLIQVKFDRIGNVSETILIDVNEELTQINDGQIQLAPNSIQVINVNSPTNVREWMVH